MDTEDKSLGLSARKEITNEEIRIDDIDIKGISPMGYMLIKAASDTGLKGRGAKRQAQQILDQVLKDHAYLEAKDGECLMIGNSPETRALVSLE